MCGTHQSTCQKESPPCDVKQSHVNSIEFNSINCIQQPLASQVHSWWPTMSELGKYICKNIGKHMIGPVCLCQTPMKATNIIIEYIASLVWTQAPPWAFPRCHSNPAAQANQGSREPSLCRMYMQMQIMAKTKKNAHGGAL